jgi:hypothetical protein
MSGSHGDLEDVTPPDDLDGVTNVGILYLQQSLYEHEGLIKLCLLVLPSDMSCEMGKNCLPPCCSMKGKKLNGSGKEMGGGRGGGGGALKEALESIVSRNDAEAKQSLALEKQTTMDTILKIIQDILKARETKERVIDELANRLGNRKKAKDVVKKNNYKVIDDDSSVPGINGNDNNEDKHLLTELRVESVNEYGETEEYVAYL